MKLTDLSLNIALPLLLGGCMYINPTWAFARNYAADGLWSYAFASAVLIIWDRRINFTWLAMTILTAIAFEWLQYAQLVHGTADVYDLLAYLAGLLLSLLLNNYFKYRFAT